MQTPREIFNNQMQYKPSERMFNWNWTFGWYGPENGGTQFWQQTIDRWHKEGLPANLNNPESVNDHFNVDRYLQLRVNFGIWPESEKMIMESTAKFDILRNEEGFLVKQLKGDAAEMSMPEYIKRPISSRDDWNKLKKTRLDPDSPGRELFKIIKDGQVIIESSSTADNFEEARQILLTSELPIEFFIGSLFGLPRNWLGLTDIAMALYEDEAWVEEMMTHLADLYISIIKTVLDALNVPIDFAVWWEDMAYNQGPLISPKHVARLMVPNYRRVNDELMKRGIDVIMVDSDGNCEKLIPHWLVSGINCVFPNEVAAGNDVVRLADKFGKDLRLIGGIDKRSLAVDRETINQELQKRLPLVARGGYLPSVDHSVPPDISYEKYRYYMDEQIRMCDNYLK